MNVSRDPQLESMVEPILSSRTVLSDTDASPRPGVVNRTHRVVRQRAKLLKARRTHVRGLMVPLLLCSMLLLLTLAAVWSGLYQYQAVEAAEAVQADVAALAASDATNHLLAVLFWFGPVSIAVLGMFLFRRSRSGFDRGTVR